MPRTTLLRKQVTPTGTISSHAGGTAPEGYLICDGSIVLIADYPRLYEVIGTSWGYVANDGLTFHLPDLRGRFLRGVDGTASSDPDKNSRIASNAGGNIGNAVGSLQGHASQTHDHSSAAFSDRGYPDGYGDRASTYYFMHPVRGTNYSLPINSRAETGPNAQASANETRPINVTVNYIIKAV